MQNWYFNVLLICLMLPHHIGAQSSSHPEGWHWYKELPEDVKTKNERIDLDKKASPTLQVTQPSSPWDQKLKSLQKQHDEALAKAIMNPTHESVESVLKLHKEIMDKALVFQKMWSQVLLQKGQTFMDPELNTSGLFRKIKEKDQQQELHTKLTKLSKQYGLFLALKKGCPYCDAFVPIVQEFARDNGFELLGIGDVSASSYKFKVLADNGVLNIINPDRIYPALFLVNLKQKEVWPLAWGLNSLSDLEINAQIVVDQILKGKPL